VRKPQPPAFIQPELATLVKEPPAGDEWLHEIKFDGYRILARKDEQRVRLASRRDKDWTDAFPTVRAAIEQLAAGTARVDGEVAAVLPDGRTSFQSLQNALDGNARHPPSPISFSTYCTSMARTT
jgi:bifunctional non-homologous end joining protein LigD